jgi:hypothetical protein
MKKDNEYVALQPRRFWRFVGRLEESRDAQAREI